MDPKKCVGCRNCEYACSFNRTGMCKSEDSNIKVNYYIEEVACIPMTCVHCEEAWCLEVCPAAAISRDEKTGAVVIDKERCAGCKMCMLACPYGNIHFDKTNKVSRKCDLCGDKEPNCVKHCIAGALQFEETEEAFKFKRKQFDGQVKKAIVEDKGQGGK
jgi:Fe-S-cluster-containing dehydrogenase component